MALSVSCTCCALVMSLAGYCGYLCYPTAVMRQWPLWSNPVPLSLIRCTCVVPLFLRCCVICHMVLIALKSGKVLRIPLRSYRLYNRISQFRFDTGVSRAVISSKDFWAMGDGVFSDKIEHLLVVSACDTLWVRWVGHLVGQRMHCTIRNGWISLDW